MRLFVVSYLSYSIFSKEKKQYNTPMKNNPALTVMQMESALNNMQNTMVTEDGNFNLDDTFFELFDDLMIKLQETRKIAQDLREREAKK